ncbi:hypothetical protein B0A50_04186 [Salinomyces thailandicus]|uniref:Uncharacterized protein n=1 Tax=Salinomyces thailandicus TaxID=706561 RepID=A0A4U0U0K5_9PEZI|nr:hypothetical protein B0A50_04186 [Salinomyces thailandica]
MKPFTAAALAAIACSSSLASAEQSGHVYILDPSRQPQPSHADPPTQTVDPVAARLVLAQRAGVADYHSGDLATDGVLDAINDFGARTPMFAGEEKTVYRRSFILVERTQDEEDALPATMDRQPSFALSSSPSYDATRGLWIDLAKQAQPHIYGALSDDDAIETMIGTKAAVASPGQDLFHIASSFAELESILNNEKMVDGNVITIYVSPPSDGTGSWGSYTMPTTNSAQSSLRKRASAPPTSETPLHPSPSNKTLNHDLHPLAKPHHNSTIIPGILPACFPTLASCQETTRNCSGHGSCSKKYSDNSASDKSRSRDCYTCQCKATTKTLSSSGEDKQVSTIYWAGSACQKQDVSVEFWMIALFTIGLVFLVCFAVGSVWDMGSEELPSVIGAGVSGPPKR